VAVALSSLPSLIDLKINLSTQNEALMILNQLPNLLYLNGKSTRDETHIVDIEDKDIESISLNNEIANFNDIFTKISERLKSINKESNKEFFDSFQDLLKTEIVNINKSVDNTVPNYIYATNVLSSKIKIFKYFKTKYLEILDTKDSDSAKVMREVVDNILKSSDFLINIIYKLYPKIDEKTDNLRKQLDEALKAAQIVDSEIGGFEEKIRSFTKERESLVKQHNEERQFLLEKIERLEKENKMITEKLLKNAKDIINSNTTGLGSGNNGEKPSHREKEESSHKETNFNHSVNMGVTGNNFNHLNESLNKSKIANNVVVGPTGSRILTIKMMKDIINEIYSSKVDFDKKCLENKMPRETMEQHMYTYLNQKYGLKNLIIEWATSIINGIKMYSSEDSDICLFGKILRNELEEDSRLVLQRLKTTISDLLSYFLKSKAPLKSNGEIKDTLNSKINGSLLEDEWKGIVYYVYEKEDANNLETRIVEFIRKKNNISKLDNSNKKMTREEIINLSRQKEEFKIAYKDFQKILLDYQIKSRDKYLKNFVYIFKKSDNDNNGIINEDEFIQLLTFMGVYGDMIEENSIRLLSVVDPYNNKQITFSECVSLFSMVSFNLFIFRKCLLIKMRLLKFHFWIKFALMRILLIFKFLF
jgi:hypothetical protein